MLLCGRSPREGRTGGKKQDLGAEAVREAACLLSVMFRFKFIIRNGASQSGLHPPISAIIQENAASFPTGQSVGGNFEIEFLSWK